MTGLAREICLTELDVVRIETLLEDLRRRKSQDRQGVEALEDRVDAARVVHATCIEPQVVTMNSVVVLTDAATNVATELTLVYPKDADADRGRVSVLSPVGRALIGARIGDVLRVVVQAQRDNEFKVTAIPYQPEADGRYDL
ncbi:MAG: elongation factor GreAB [Steroidobacteraceae bacterium]|nr:elongation factor GreAB [Steroidobacteraceae bacterium]